jgi:hypothetical protein
METDIHAIKYTEEEKEEEVKILISHRKTTETTEEEGEEEGKGADGADDNANKIIEDFDFAIDPYFFDDGYSVAGTTGFVRVWEGADIFSTKFLSQERKLYENKNVVELGSGVGLCGLVCAFLGAARVTLTDLPSVVEGILIHNIEQNKITGERPSEESCCWVRVGSSFARGVALNWEKPLSCECLTVSEKEEDSIDVIIAAECIWLADLIECFCETLNLLFEREFLLRKRFPKCFIASRDRSSRDSKIFASEELVESCFKKFGLSFEIINYYPSVIDTDRFTKVYSLTKEEL